MWQLINPLEIKGRLRIMKQKIIYQKFYILNRFDYYF